MLSRVNLCLSHQVILTSRVDALTFYPEGEELESGQRPILVLGREIIDHALSLS